MPKLQNLLTGVHLLPPWFHWHQAPNVVTVGGERGANVTLLYFLSQCCTLQSCRHFNNVKPRLSNSSLCYALLSEFRYLKEMMEWSTGTFFKSAGWPFTYNWITWQYFDRNKDYLKIWSRMYFTGYVLFLGWQTLRWIIWMAKWDVLFKIDLNEWSPLLQNSCWSGGSHWIERWTM